MDHKKPKAAANAEKGVISSGPNIKFSGRRRPGSAAPAPLERIHFHGRVIELPAADTQKRKRLFYHADAALISKLFPHLYKNVIRRGIK